jgi:16S rRNA C1402 N4-methylase RsmH
LGALRSLLRSIDGGATAATAGNESWLRRGARVGIISFHSLEDRLVKHSFVDMSKRSVVEVRTRKPVVSSDEETAENPRARSAKLRVVRVAMVGIPGQNPDPNRWGSGAE